MRESSVYSVRLGVTTTPGCAHVHVGSDRDLLIVMVMRIGRGRQKRPRWVHVMDVLSTGSTVAAEICRALDLDPEEIVGDRR